MASMMGAMTYSMAMRGYGLMAIRGYGLMAIRGLWPMAFGVQRNRLQLLAAGTGKEV